MKRCALYLRCSTNETKQNVERQESELRDVISNHNWELVEVYADYSSGRKTQRPNLDRLLDDAFSKKFDCVMVSDLSRLGRNVQHLLKIVEELDNKNIELFSLREKIDTDSATGKLFFTIISALNEFQVSQIRENVRSGLANAKRKGIKLGRKPVVHIAEIKKIKKLRKKGDSIRTIAKKMSISTATIQRCLNDTHYFS
jgi:DNA invertase Pin-like site-specific DNA recombinase